MTPTDTASGEHEAQPTDLAEKLIYVMADTGSLQEQMGGFRIRVIHERGFPWADICRIFAVRGFKINVLVQKNTLFIEAAV